MALLSDYVDVKVDLFTGGSRPYEPSEGIVVQNRVEAIWQPACSVNIAAINDDFVDLGLFTKVNDSTVQFTGTTSTAVGILSTNYGGRVMFEAEVLSTNSSNSFEYAEWICRPLFANYYVSIRVNLNTGMGQIYHYTNGIESAAGAPFYIGVGKRFGVILDSTQSGEFGYGVLVDQTIYVQPFTFGGVDYDIQRFGKWEMILQCSHLDLATNTRMVTNYGNEPFTYVVPSGYYTIGQQASQSTGDVEEAPIDGTQYGRKDGAWTPIEQGGGGGGGGVITMPQTTFIADSTRLDGNVYTFDSDIATSSVAYINDIPTIRNGINRFGFDVTTSALNGSYSGEVVFTVEDSWNGDVMISVGFNATANEITFYDMTDSPIGAAIPFTVDDPVSIDFVQVANGSWGGRAVVGGVTNYRVTAQTYTPEVPSVYMYDITIPSVTKMKIKLDAFEQNRTALARQGTPVGDLVSVNPLNFRDDELANADTNLEYKSFTPKNIADIAKQFAAGGPVEVFRQVNNGSSVSAIRGFSTVVPLTFDYSVIKISMSRYGDFETAFSSFDFAIAALTGNMNDNWNCTYTQSLSTDSVNSGEPVITNVFRGPADITNGGILNNLPIRLFPFTFEATITTNMNSVAISNFGRRPSITVNFRISGRTNTSRIDVTGTASTYSTTSATKDSTLNLTLNLDGTGIGTGDAEVFDIVTIESAGSS